MTNHPSRSWRRRAHAAADVYLLRLAATRPDLGALVDQAERILRAVYVDGYGDGRLDAQRPPRAAHRPESDAMAAAVDEIRQRLARGDAPETAAVAERHGVSRARLSVACGRAGLELPRGRPRKAPAGERKNRLTSMLVCPIIRTCAGQ